MSQKPLRRVQGVIHAIARCEVCGQEFTSYKNAKALAAKHYNQTGHKVTGEECVAFEYSSETRRRLFA